jgi:type VI protein secretion system component VasK
MKLRWERLAIWSLLAMGCILAWVWNKTYARLEAVEDATERAASCNAVQDSRIDVMHEDIREIKADVKTLLRRGPSGNPK